MEASAARTIARGALAEWLARLIEGAQVIAPSAGPGGDVAYAPVSAPDQVLWEFGNALEPPKQVVLPTTDELLAIRHNGRGFEVEPIYDERPRVLFNLRSCDAAGIAFLTRMHTADLPDAGFLRRAGQLTVVTLACAAPCPLGFCVCCNAGPFLHEGYDVQLTDLGEELLAEPGSERGSQLLVQAGELFRASSEAQLRRRLEIEEEARRQFGEETCHFASAMRRISTGRVSEQLWGEMGEWCFECGGCNLICPTCYCFSVKDQRRDGGWVRCRTADSCQWAAFTLEASGHNPRPSRRERMKRRFFHKVSAQYFQRDGTVGCVGCGRCVTVCLGTTDMPAVVAAIRKGVWRG